MKQAHALIDHVILRKMGSPAENKWKKLAPALYTLILMTNFFRLVPTAVERACNLKAADIRPEHVAVDHELRSEPEDAPRADPRKKNPKRKVRLGRFFGTVNTKIAALVWLTVGLVS